MITLITHFDIVYGQGGGGGRFHPTIYNGHEGGVCRLNPPLILVMEAEFAALAHVNPSVEEEFAALAHRICMRAPLLLQSD